MDILFGGLKYIKGVDRKSKILYTLPSFRWSINDGVDKS